MEKALVEHCYYFSIQEQGDAATLRCKTLIVAGDTCMYRLTWATHVHVYVQTSTVHKVHMYARAYCWSRGARLANPSRMPRVS